MTKKKRIVKILLIFMIALGSFFYSSEKTYAAGFSISASTSKVTPGSVVQVYINGLVNARGPLQISVSNGSANTNMIVASMGGSNTQTINVTVGSVGVTTVTVSSTDSGFYIIDSSGNPTEAGGSLSLNISVVPPSSGGGGTTYVPPKVNTDPDKRSADNNLAGLSVSQGKLTPDFN
ncbi:MAG: hypothetical protein RR493_07750, partial [Erysipelotrichaceae bacterium]